MAFVLEVIADNSGKWCSNGLVFATEAEAMAYGKDLWSRWTLVREYRPTPVDKPVTDAWIDGQLVKVYPEVSA